MHGQNAWGMEFAKAQCFIKSMNLAAVYLFVGAPDCVDRARYDQNVKDDCVVNFVDHSFSGKNSF